MKKFLFLFCLLPILAWPQSQIDQFQVLQLGYNASPGNPPSFTGYVYINNSGQLVCTLHNGTSCLSGGGGGTGTIIASPSPDCLPYYQGANTTLTADCALVTDTAGGLTLVKLTVSGVSTGIITLKTGSAPSNPSSGYCSLYVDSGTNVLSGLNSSGGTCMPAAASPGGSSSQLQFNNGLGGFGGASGLTWNNATSTFTLPDGATWDSSGTIDITSSGELDFTGGVITASTPTLGNAFEISGNAALGVGRLIGAESTHSRQIGITEDVESALISDCNSSIATFRIFHIGDPSNFPGSPNVCLDDTNIYFSTLNSVKYQTKTNCAGVGTAASPSVVSCSAAAAGAFSCATNASAGTCTINTTAVTANSEIFVTEVADEGTRLSVTCNTSPTVVPAIILASKSAGVSFTINMPTITVNPACFNFFITN